MSELPSSPERPAIKVTYMDRQKRKRKITDVTDDTLNSGSNSNDVKTMPIYASTLKEGFMKPTSKAPDSKGPLKLDFHLPGPMKRARRDAEEPDAVNGSHLENPKKFSHKRSSSSISSFTHVVRKIVAASPASKKPPSVASSKSAKHLASRRAATPDLEVDADASKKPPSVASAKPIKPLSPGRTATPDTEVDDNTSIADSVMSVSVGRIRRTEAERIEYFRNQPECGTLEPHHAACIRCNKVVNLGRRQTYAVRPWESHRNRCDQRVPQSRVRGSDLEEGGEEGDNESTTTTPVLPCDRFPRKTLQERKAILDSDSRIVVVKPDEVKCRKCEKWIRLSSKRDYDVCHWTKHVSRCCDSKPSSRVSMAARKVELVNDPQVKSFSVSHVQCASCDISVDLNKEIAYDLAKWEEHKAKCHYTPAVTKESSKPTPNTPEPSSALNTGRVGSPVRLPSSSPSTEGTLIASEPNQRSGQSSGAKRLREESELPTDDPDARPANRPRTETYTPPQKVAPSPMGWFLLPFKAFVRGFRESLQSDS
jgi:hypothetical protein